MWLLKSLIPLMAVLLLIQGLANLLRCLLFLQGRFDRLYEDNEQPGEEL